MTTRFSTLGFLSALALSVWMLPWTAVGKETGSKESKSASAYAEFRVNPTGKRETFVVVDVSQTKSATEINFIYFVTSTSEEGDFLMYHAITGSDTIRKQDFKVHGDGKFAVLDTLIPVFDDEGGVGFEMAIQVFWVATGPDNQGTRPAVAAVNVFTPFYSAYITDFIFPSTTASITRSK